MEEASMRRTRIFAVALALVVASGVTSAGGCLQGTFHYFNDAGQQVGGETMGCGADDGFWGVRTANKTFTQGCASES